MEEKRHGREHDILAVDRQHTAVATKAFVIASIVDASDSKLPQRRGAHDAWLNRDVQVGFV